MSECPERWEALSGPPDDDDTGDDGSGPWHDEAGGPCRRALARQFMDDACADVHAMVQVAK